MSSLPEDTVGEILSWLPVKSLLGFKRVCKNWRQLIHQDDFIDKHHRRGRAGCNYQYRCENQFWSEFYCVDIQEGLLLEQEHSKGPLGRLRITNPATRQTVYSPDLPVGDETPTWVLARMFFVAKSINECTVISFSMVPEESVFLVRFRAVTVGVDAAWRPLKNFPPNFMDYFSIAPPSVIFVLSIGKIFHVVTMNDQDGNIMLVNVEEESITTIKIPENLFSNWRYVMPREWNSKLSLFSYEGYQLSIWVPMNNNKNQWAKINTFHLATPVTQNHPLPYWFYQEELRYKPSILHLKGMQSENEGEAWKEIDNPTISSQIYDFI
nr:putative F-box protein At3g52320 [Ipomoea batatas]